MLVKGINIRVLDCQNNEIESSKEEENAKTSMKVELKHQCYSNTPPRTESLQVFLALLTSNVSRKIADDYGFSLLERDRESILKNHKYFIVHVQIWMRLLKQ